MSTLFILLLASSQPLPFINRAEMDSLVQIERLQAQPVSFARRISAKSQPASNMRQIATICGAASRMPDAVEFLTDIGAAYSMSRGEVAALRETCAAYLSGRADGEQLSRVGR